MRRRAVLVALALSSIELRLTIDDWRLETSAAPPSSIVNPQSSISTTTVGIEGKVIVRHRADQPLRAAPVNDHSKITLRIADHQSEGEFILYDLRYIPQYAGEFDLREYLERLDGKPLTGAEPVPVYVGALLPAEHRGDLYEIDGVSPPRLGGYRLALIIIGGLWIVPIAYLILRRILHKKPAPVIADDHPLTLADQLRPLVESALAGTISTADRARLEMLLVTYWRDQLHLRNQTHFEAMQTLRQHDEAGAIILLMERWLHRPATSNGESIDLTSLLARYRSVGAIELPRGQEAHA